MHTHRLCSFLCFFYVAFVFAHSQTFTVPFHAMHNCWSVLNRKKKKKKKKQKKKQKNPHTSIIKVIHAFWLPLHNDVSDPSVHLCVLASPQHRHTHTSTLITSYVSFRAQTNHTAVHNPPVHTLSNYAF